MKKIMVAFLCLLSTVILPAQGVYQLWGTTPLGGANDAGVIFNTDAAGDNFQLKHQFTSGISIPIITRQLVEYNGKFYGVGNSSSGHEPGFIFEWDAATNGYTKKYNFNNANGITPAGFTLLAGKFYGTTAAGGIYGGGVIFEWDPATNVYTKKFDFDGINGARPGAMTFFNGKFYGAASTTGDGPFGAFFEWDPVTNVFTSRATIRPVISGLTLWNGKFYGTSRDGGERVFSGGIFEWDPVTDIFIEKQQFSSAPSALTLIGDKFYGLGNADDNSGTGTTRQVLFEWDPATNGFSEKVDFTTTDGAAAINLTAAFGKLYGIALRGGSNDLGVIFEYDPVADTYIKKVDFNSTNGTFNGTLTLSGGKFYGLFFVWDPATNTYAYNVPSAGSDINGYGPSGSLAFNSGKFSGLTSSGGTNKLGVIFQYDPAFNSYIKRYDLSDSSGYGFGGRLIFNDGKFYGLMSNGGANSMGVIFEWDPVTNAYTKKIDFDGTNGAGPGGSLVPYAGKFYGVASGGSKNWGVIFEWDPATNLYTKKYDFDIINNMNLGRSPNGPLVLNNGKFYGITYRGGVNDAGVIFEWDPATNVYTKRFDLFDIGGVNPYGSLTLYGDKFYGMTENGGSNSRGIIFEWDPATNAATKKIDLIDSSGSGPQGSLTLSGGKFYGMTRSGGTRTVSEYGGVIFEWDPVTNVYTKKKDFLWADGATPWYGHDLTPGPAPVAQGLPGSCVSLPAVTIDNSNNNKWVAITDQQGNAVAEIKANGNNLGIVTASMYVNNSTVREDGAGTLYLDRNINLSPQSQPTSAVDIRLYIKASEFMALKNATNSNGQGAGIDSIAGLLIYKDGSDCSAAASSLTNGVATTGALWETDYVLAASITSFSSFYFAGNSSTCVPPVVNQVFAHPSILWPPNHAMKIVTVNYKAKSDCGPVTSSLSVASDEPVTGTGYWDLAPDWQILDDHHVKLRAERAGRGNGRRYTITITSKDANGTITRQKTKVIVPNLFSLFFSKGSGIANRSDGYIDDNGEYFDQVLDCKVTPNPSTRNFNLQIGSASNERVEVRLLDISGRLIKQFNTIKGKTLRFGDDLRPGVYMADIIQGSQHKIIKLVKQ